MLHPSPHDWGGTLGGDLVVAHVPVAVCGVAWRCCARVRQYLGASTGLRAVPYVAGACDPTRRRPPSCTTLPLALGFLHCAFAPRSHPRRRAAPPVLRPSRAHPPRLPPRATPPPTPQQAAGAGRLRDRVQCGARWQ